MTIIGLGAAVAVSTALQSLQGGAQWRPYLLIGASATGVVAVWQLVAATLLARPVPVPPGVEQLTPSDPRQVGGYRLVGRLGAGAMGRAYLGLTSKGDYVAVKVIRPEYADDHEFRRRFAREVDAIKKVRSPYTSQLVDAGAQAEQPWMVTPYIAGPSLQSVIDTYGPWPAASVWRLAAGTAEALYAIHAAGIIHRDLKPANILLAPDGPRVIDFGIARASDATHLTATVNRPGTPAFMAPEQALGQPITPATDIFALGVLLAYAATGRNPFGEGTGEGILYRVVHQEPDLTGIDDPLRELIAQCLDKQPGRRPTPSQIVTSAYPRALAFAHHHWLPTPVAAYTTNMVNLVPKPRRQPVARGWPTTVVASAALLIAFAGLALQVDPELAWWANNQETKSPPRFVAPSPSPSPSPSTSLSPSPSPSPSVARRADAFEMPDLVNKEFRTARIEALSRKLGVNVVFNERSGKANGTVVRTNPAAGVLIFPGLTILLYVVGPPPTVSVPQVVGLLCDEAKIRILDAGLKISAYPSGTRGTLTQVEPSAGTTLNWNDSVSLHCGTPSTPMPAP